MAGKKLNRQIMEKVWEALGTGRLYASFWDWPNKGAKERGVVCALLKTIQANGELHELENVQANKSDPPDCVGTKANGELVAFEVTELVDQEVVEHHERVARECVAQNTRDKSKWTANAVFAKFRCLRRSKNRLVVKEWEASEFVERVQAILRQKDARDFHGGPYARVVLVIHTSEPDLCCKRDDYGRILRRQNLGLCKQITDVYLLFSYQPGMKSCPFLHLELPSLSH